MMGGIKHQLFVFNNDGKILRIIMFPYRGMSHHCIGKGKVSALYCTKYKWPGLHCLSSLHRSLVTSNEGTETLLWSGGKGKNVRTALLDMVLLQFSVDSGMIVVIFICLGYLLLVIGLLFFVKNDWCDLLFRNMTVGFYFFFIFQTVLLTNPI